MTMSTLISSHPWLASLVTMLLASPAVLYLLYLHLLPKPIPGIPHNPEATRNLLGDCPSLINEGNRNLMEWTLAQCRRNRSPIFQFFLRPLKKPHVVLMDFAEAHDVMMHSRDWDRTDWAIQMLGGGDNPHHHINLKTGPRWRAQRRLLQDVMAPAFLNDVVAPNVHAGAMRLVDLWRAKDAVGRGRPFAAGRDMHLTALDAMFDFSFGLSVEQRAIPPQVRHVKGLPREKEAGTEEEDELVEFDEAPIHETLQAVLHWAEYFLKVMTSWNHSLAWFLKKFDLNERRVVRVRHDFVKEEISKAVNRLRERREAAGKDDDGSDSWTRSAVDVIIAKEQRFADKEGRKPAFWSPMLRDEVLGFMIAGNDTTSAVMAWSLKILADAQNGAQATLRRHLHAAHATAHAEKRTPSAGEIAHTHIPYLDAVIKELLRCARAVPFHERQCNRDTVLLGYHLPKGTTVLMPTFGPSMTEPAMEIDEKLRGGGGGGKAGGTDKGEGSDKAQTGLGVKKGQPQTKKETVGDGNGATSSVPREWPDPETSHVFRPERWLKPDPDGTGGDVLDAHAGPAMPFGLGLRGCFGPKFAHLEMRVLVTVLLWNFELLRCPEELSSYEAVDDLFHRPKYCYVKAKGLQGVGEGPGLEGSTGVGFAGCGEKGMSA